MYEDFEAEVRVPEQHTEMMDVPQVTQDQPCDTGSAFAEYDSIRNEVIEITENPAAVVYGLEGNDLPEGVNATAYEYTKGDYDVFRSRLMDLDGDGIYETTEITRIGAFGPNAVIYRRDLDGDGRTDREDEFHFSSSVSYDIASNSMKETVHVVDRVVRVDSDRDGSFDVIQLQINDKPLNREGFNSRYFHAEGSMVVDESTGEWRKVIEAPTTKEQLDQREADMARVTEALNTTGAAVYDDTDFTEDDDVAEDESTVYTTEQSERNDFIEDTEPEDADEDEDIEDSTEDTETDDAEDKTPVVTTEQSERNDFIEDTEPEDADEDEDIEDSTEDTETDDAEDKPPVVTTEQSERNDFIEDTEPEDADEDEVVEDSTEDEDIEDSTEDTEATDEAGDDKGDEADDAEGMSISGDTAYGDVNVLVNETADTNGDGFEDYGKFKYSMDTNGDGVDEIYYWETYDLDADGYVDTVNVLADLDSDGRYESAEQYSFDASSLNYELVQSIDLSDPERGTYSFELDSFDPSSADMSKVDGNPGDVMDLWEYQGDSFRCAIYSQKFIFEEFTGVELDIEDLVSFAKQEGWFSDNGGTSPEDLNKILDAYGIDNEMGYNYDISDIQTALQKGDKVIVALDSGEYWMGESNDIYAPVDGADHAVEVIGLDWSDPEKPMVILNDSGAMTGKGEMVPLDTFMAAWGDSEHLAVIAHRK